MSSTENPWKCVDTRLIYENPWIRVREDRVIGPNGKPGIYSVVDTRIATAVVALTEDRRVYLVGQFRYPVDEYTWEVIEGGSDPKESAISAARRELREEAGLAAREWRQVGGELQLSNCFSSERGYVFLATGLTEVGAEPDESEVLALRTVPLAECVRMVDEGEIKDALSIMALLKVERFLTSGGLEKVKPLP